MARTAEPVFLTENPGSYMPTTRPEEGRPREESCAANYPETADEQEQNGPVMNRKRTSLEHREDAMAEHATLGRLLAQ